MDMCTDSRQIKGGQSFPRLYYKTFLPFLTEKLSSAELPKVEIPKVPKWKLDDNADSQEITTTWFWPEMSNFFRPHDVVLCDTGTSLFGIQDTKFPNDLT